MIMTFDNNSILFKIVIKKNSPPLEYEIPWLMYLKKPNN